MNAPRTALERIQAVLNQERKDPPKPKEVIPGYTAKQLWLIGAKGDPCPMDARRGKPHSIWAAGRLNWQRRRAPNP